MSDTNYENMSNEEIMQRGLELKANAGKTPDAENNNNNNNTSTDEGNQELIFGKYKTLEDAEKSFKELQAFYTKTKQNTPKDTPDNTSEPTDEKKDLTIPDEEKEAKGEEASNEGAIDFEKYSNHYMENGALDESHYEELAKMGISKDIVDTYINGVVASQNQMAYDVFNHVGGEQAFNSMRDWAAKNLSDFEKNAFNNAMNSGNKEQMIVALDHVNSLYTKGTKNTMGAKFDPSKGNSINVSNDTTKFANRSEYLAALRDPRMQTDPNYKEQVYAKLRNSKEIYTGKVFGRGTISV